MSTFPRDCAIAARHPSKPLVRHPAARRWRPRRVYERGTLAAFDYVDVRRLDPAIIDGDNVVILREFAFHHKSGAIVRLDELAQQRVSERFFYDLRTAATCRWRKKTRPAWQGVRLTTAFLGF